MSGELAALPVPTNLDRAALAAYCGACALWPEATLQIEKSGALIKSPQGFPIQSPYLAIANRQAEIVMRIATPPPDGGLFALLDDPTGEAAS